AGGRAVDPAPRRRERRGRVVVRIAAVRRRRSAPPRETSRRSARDFGTRSPHRTHGGDLDRSARVVRGGTEFFRKACHPERSVTESRDLDGSLKLSTISDFRDSSTALRPRSRLRSARDDARFEFRYTLYVKCLRKDETFRA